jgi:hypothetical protein
MIRKHSEPRLASASHNEAPMTQAPSLDILTTRFCRALGEDTGRHPMQWRSILVVGARCRIRAPKELERTVSHGVKAGWFETRDGRSVALTDAGRQV